MRKWSDPLGVTTTDREEKIKVLIPKEYSFCDDKSDDLQKYLPCIAIVSSIIGDACYEFRLITEDGIIKTFGYERNVFAL